MTEIQRLAGVRGTDIITSLAAQTNLNYDYIIPREDTVLSVCSGVDDSDNPIDFLSTNNWGVTLKNTDILIVPKDYKITAITITSGSLQCF